MPEDRLKTAVVGLDEGGQRLLRSLSGMGEVFTISAVADADDNTAQTAGRIYSADWFDDLRQMSVQKDLDVVISCGPLHSSIEYLHAAMKKGAHVLRYPPAARSYGEAAELFRTAEENDVIFAVARWWRYKQAAGAIREYIQSNPEEQFYLIEGWCSVMQPSNHAWLKDPQLAGGGVVLNLAYPLIDQITTLFSVPQQVYAVCTNQAPDRKQRSLLTEETAVVSMKFDDRLIGKVTASRTMWPDGWLIRVHGRNCRLIINEKGLSIRDLAGKLIRRPSRQDSLEASTQRMLRDFAAAILAGDYKPFEKEAAETLGNMALIQAAYLSDKTGMPEEPARIAEMGSA